MRHTLLQFGTLPRYIKFKTRADLTRQNDFDNNRGKWRRTCNFLEIFKQQKTKRTVKSLKYEHGNWNKRTQAANELLVLQAQDALNKILCVDISITRRHILRRCVDISTCRTWIMKTRGDLARNKRGAKDGRLNKPWLIGL